MLFISLLFQTILLIIHLIEEIRTGFRKRFPLGKMPVWIFISGNIVIYAFAATMLILVNQADPLGNIFAWIFSIGVLLNGAGHILFMVYKRKYFPGGWTAIPLILAAIYTITVL